MGNNFFSARHRAAHLGPYPLERLVRADVPSDPGRVAPDPELAFVDGGGGASILGAMTDYQAMMDVIRDGPVNPVRAAIPDDPEERARHLKGFGYFCDAAMVGICALRDGHLVPSPRRNPEIDRLAADLRTRQTKTLASGIDLIMADLREAAETPPGPMPGHSHAIVLLYETPRPPRPDEPGAAWIAGAGAQRSALRANETATVLANYLRLLGHDARAHSATTSDVFLARLAVSAGLCWADADADADSDSQFASEQPVTAPFVGRAFGLAAVTCDLTMTPDRPLAPPGAQPANARKTPGQWSGWRRLRTARNTDPYRSRDFHAGPHPFETLRRVDAPTTYIDEANVARVPKRADMFARAQFGDMGKPVQEGATGGMYIRRAPYSMAQRRLLGAFTLLQDGPSAPQKQQLDPADAAALVKATSYYLGIDAVGISRCPEWAWYSHDATGTAIEPPHDQAISMIVDQGYETMEGASGDDWISAAQSMRAYLRFSLIGGVVAAQIRRLGYKAKAHTVMDGEVLQPPLLLLSGLGEVSRIGEVILNPYLGPRLKSGVVTTDLPMAHDKPIDFGLQRFCEGCNKCARECPSGAITAGPKLMFNGYEIWKSDSQKCATYRITTKGGAMCGRCMKTCPWNLEGVFKEAPFRWAAMNLPAAAPVLQRMDDLAGRGGLNPSKKWWWDIGLNLETGGYEPASEPVNARGLQPELKLDYADQTLAVYPAPLAPHPWPYPFAMDREAGIAAYQAMVTPDEYRARLARGETGHIHRYANDSDSPVIRVEVSKVEPMTAEVTKYEFKSLDGAPLPEWTAGAHLDIVVVPEFLRQYSMSGDPANRDHFQIGVLREDEGRGGSKTMHRIFTPGRKVFISPPINHFELVEDAPHSLLMGGGIGITPMIAFGHRLHALGRSFALHYSVPSRDKAGYLDDLAQVAWADKVHLHVSNEGSRIDLDAVLGDCPAASHVYTCGPDRYMGAVMEAAERQGFPEECRHLEYFSVPEQPEYENHAFTLRLKNGREIAVAETETATDALARAGVHVDVKCADGICGVCKCGIVSGAVEHRDFVLSNAQRETAIILCQSRAAEPDGVIEIDL